MARRNRYDSNAPAGSYMSQFTEEEWESLEPGMQRKLAVMGGPFGRSEFSAEEQMMMQDIERRELGREALRATALSGAQLGAQALMYASPSARRERELAGQIEQQMKTRDFLDPAERQATEQAFMGQAGTLAEEEQARMEALAGSVGGTAVTGQGGVETMREAARVKEGRQFEAAKEAGKAITSANLQATREKLQQYDQLKETATGRVRGLLETTAQGIGSAAEAYGTIRAFAPGENVGQLVNELREMEMPDPDNPGQMMAAFSGPERVMIIGELRRMSPKQRRKYLAELEVERELESGKLTSLLDPGRAEATTAEEAGEQEEEQGQGEAEAQAPRTQEQFLEALNDLPEEDTGLQKAIIDRNDGKEMALDFRDWFNENYSDAASTLRLDDSDKIEEENYSDAIIIGSSPNSSMAKAWEYDIDGNSAGRVWLSFELLEDQTQAAQGQ